MPQQRLFHSMLSARNKILPALLAAALLLLTGLPSLAQEASSADPAQEDSPMGSFVSRQVGGNENINKISARRLFGSKATEAKMKPAAIGAYALGCMAGAQQLPMNGDSWQVMRPSRNRNWGLPQLVSLLEKLSAEAKAKAGWNGFLVGDMAQPRGGPMLSGHASHQIGLDADVWFTPMPDHVLDQKERESMVPKNMVIDHRSLDTEAWTESRAKLIQIVASDPAVERIFVHPPIKRQLCQWSGGKAAWLAKVRPLFGHTYHFHIRMKCPQGMASCKPQGAPKPEDGTGCGKELAYWYSEKPWARKKPVPGAPKPKPAPPLTLSGLPAQCRAVIAAP
jgi:penicillin-insensitive murein DD-endopeptidase